MRTMLALVAVAAALAAAADARSSTRFVSKRYGYSVPWRGGPPFQNQPEVDFYSAADGRALAAAARSLPRRSTLRKWASLYVGTALPSFCTKSRGYRATALGGAPALAFTAACEAHDINVALTVRRGRGYAFVLASPRAFSAAADRRVFESARRSFRFR
jgi:predicted Zn-dependent protease